FVIQTNVPMTLNSMTRTVIEGYFYDASAPFRIDLGAYLYSSGTFPQKGFINVGSKTIEVQLGKNISTGNVVIILGDPGSTYSYPKLTISEFSAGHTVVSEAQA